MQLSQLRINLLISGFLFLLFFFLFSSPTFAQLSFCQQNTRTEGLISAKDLTSRSIFGNPTGICVVDPDKASFVPFKIPNYDELKSIYYDQEQTSANLEKMPVIQGNATQANIPLTGANNRTYYVTGDLNITQNINGNNSGIIFVGGNLYVGPTSNNKLKHGNNLSGIVFVVKGDVNIYKDIVEIDGVYISSGYICTSHNGTNCDILDSRVFTSQLIVNGSLIALNPAKPLSLRRNLIDNADPAEKVQSQVKYLVLLKDIYSETIQKWSEITADIPLSGDPCRSAKTPDSCTATSANLQRFFGKVCTWTTCSNSTVSGICQSTNSPAEEVCPTDDSPPPPPPPSDGISLPIGSTAYFNLSSCPSGWSELTSARGRYVVGLPAGGSLSGTQGTALSNLENRAVGQHNHTIYDPGHLHNLTAPNSGTNGGVWQTGNNTAGPTLAGALTSSVTTGITINSSGSITGTNAPYIQLLVCQKTSAPPSSPLLNGLIAYWKMDNTGSSILDSKGGNNGNATGTSIVTGKQGNARSFNGTGDYIDVPDNANLDFGQNQDFTVGFWIKTSQTTPWTIIANKQNPVSPVSGWEIFINNTSNPRWLGQIRVVGQNLAVPGCLDIADSQWHYIVLARNGVNLKSYADGQDCNSDWGDQGGNISSSAPLRFGQANGGGQYFNGILDEIGIWNRALSTQEISNLYNTGSGRTYPF